VQSPAAITSPNAIFPNMIRIPASRQSLASFVVGIFSHLSSTPPANQMDSRQLASRRRFCHLQRGGSRLTMFQPTLDQVRRAFRIVSGFTLLLIGVIMLITPGPGVAHDFSWLEFAGCRIRLGRVVL